MNRRSAAAWECAYVLMQDFADRLSIEQMILCVTTDLAGPDNVADPDAVLALYRTVVVERV